MGREPLGVASAELTQSVQAGGVDPDPAAVVDCKQEVWGSTPRVSTQVRGPFRMTGGVSLVAVKQSTAPRFNGPLSRRVAEALEHLLGRRRHLVVDVHRHGELVAAGSSSPPAGGQPERRAATRTSVELRATGMTRACVLKGGRRAQALSAAVVDESLTGLGHEVDRALTKSLTSP